MQRYELIEVKVLWLRLNSTQNQSNTTSETSSVEIGSSSPALDYGGHEKSDDEEAYHTRHVERGSFDVSAMQSLLKELHLESEIDGDAHVSSLSGIKELYEIRPSEGKGLGVFAIVDISKGTRIMADQCLFSVIGPNASYADIEATFNGLSSRDKNRYMQLRCPDYPGRSPVIRTWEANCFAMGQNTGIFPVASRINHSCTPNAHFAWNTNISRETVHAILDISAGQEIEISYCPTHKDAFSRRKKLEGYGFDCNCDACRQATHTGRVSEERRRQMMELKHEINESAFNSSPRKTSRSTPDLQRRRLELIRLLEEEQLYQKELGSQYRDVAIEFDSCGEKETAKQYAKKALQNDIRCFGIDSPIVQQDTEILRLLKMT